MKKLLAECEMIDYYFSKIESYLGRKHKNILQNSSAVSNYEDSCYSGSPKSTLSDRVQIFEEEDLSGFDKVIKNKDSIDDA